MNLAQFKTRLRARLQDRSGVQLTNDELVSSITEGLRYLQSKLLALDRSNGINVVEDYCDIAVGVKEYPLPDDFLLEMEVKVDDEVMQKVNPLSGRRGYYLNGMHLMLTWEPTAASVGGLRVRHCAAISVSDDGDVPAVPANLHMAAVVAAERVAAPTLGEGAKEQREELADLLGDLSTYFKAENGEAPQLSPQTPNRRY